MILNANPPRSCQLPLLDNFLTPCVMGSFAFGLKDLKPMDAVDPLRCFLSLCVWTSRPSTWWACHGQTVLSAKHGSSWQKETWFKSLLTVAAWIWIQTSKLNCNCSKRCCVSPVRGTEWEESLSISQYSILPLSSINKFQSAGFSLQLSLDLQWQWLPRCEKTSSLSHALSRHPEHSSKLPWLSGWFSAEPWLRWNVGNHVSNLNIVAFCEDIVQ